MTLSAKDCKNSHPATGHNAGILKDVRKQLGHEINFANQGDREAIGNALVKKAREGLQR